MVCRFARVYESSESVLFASTEGNCKRIGLMAGIARTSLQPGFVRSEEDEVGEGRGVQSRYDARMQASVAISRSICKAQV